MRFGSEPYSLATGDLNGDGKPDFVVADAGNYSVSVLLGNGNGAFHIQQSFTSGSGQFSRAIGDLTGDGIPDLVVANINSDTVGVLLGNGNGTLRTQQTLATGASPYSVAVGDINGDGKPDIVVACINGTTGSVFLNGVTGNFTGQIYTVASSATTQFAVTAPSSVTAGIPFTITVTAENSSGSTVPSYSGTVRFSVSDGGALLPAATTLTNGVGVFTMTLETVGNQTFTATDSVTAAITGSATINVSSSGSLSPPPVVQSINRSTPAGPSTSATTLAYTVTFSEAVTGVVPADFQLALSGTVAGMVTQVTPVSGLVYTVTVGGITGAGTLGLNLVDNGTIHDLAGHRLVQSGFSPAFQSQPPIAAGADARPEVLADVNGDGIPDMIFGNYNSNSGSNNDHVSVLLGNGNGTFQNALTFATQGQPLSIAAGDVNGDGKPDLVVANGNGNTVSVLLGNGNGTFQSQNTFATGAGTTTVAIADVNGDGKSDLVVACRNSWIVSVLLGNGNGSFQSQLTYAAGPTAFAAAVADVNGDGKPGLIVVADVGGLCFSVHYWATATALSRTRSPLLPAVTPIPW